MPFKSIVGWALRKRLHQIELFKKYPHEVQEELLLNLMQKARNTQWGKKYSYSKIHTLSDFSLAVPLSTYSDLLPIIERIMQGETNLLWPNKIMWFAKSSGTTSGKSKIIPVSKEALTECHYKGGKDLLAIYFDNHPKSFLYNGKSLVVGGSSKALGSHSDSNAYLGDLSAIIIKNLPMWVELRRTPNLDIALMDNWEEKLDKMAAVTADENVTNISGVPSWTLLLLSRILEIKHAHNLDKIWPNLQLFMHGGISFKPYEKQFKEILPKNTSYIETYNASEGFFGIQDKTDSDDMLLMLDYGIYYEFIPMTDFFNDNSPCLTLGEIEINVQYAIVISTNAGLWRYVIGDTIVFTKKHPYRIRITGRTRHFINAFGEELIVENADTAIYMACKHTKSVITDYTVAPVYMEMNKSGCHEWLIEFEKEPANLSSFIEVLDKSLKSLNSDYEAKRNANLLLLPPQIRCLKTNTFFNWMKKRGKLGGQNKVSRLMNNRKVVDDILAFCDNNEQLATNLI